MGSEKVPMTPSSEGNDGCLRVHSSLDSPEDV